MDLEEAEVFDMNRHVEEPEYHPRSHLKIDESSKVSKAIDPKRERYPFCIAPWRVFQYEYNFPIKRVCVRRVFEQRMVQQLRLLLPRL